MSGIVAFGASVPAYRLPREVIAREWGQPSRLGRVEIDMPVQLIFGKIHQGAGLNNYFWKARPAS
jgi:hypothetical protein